MTIENRFDIAFTAAIALKEKQIQQNYRPIIAVHKWFARRPGSLFRALALSEFGDSALPEIYFKANKFCGLKIADPFMGGGTPLIEANRIGCDVYGFDINPLAAWIVREEIEHLDVDAYSELASTVMEQLANAVEHLYQTDCPHYGDTNVPVKYFLWVKVLDCEGCNTPIDLFPGYLLAEDSRHPKNVFVCHNCGDLNEVDDRNQPGKCNACSVRLRIEGPAKRNRCTCSICGKVNTYPHGEKGPLRHRLFAIEYFNPKRKSHHKGRFFKKADQKDLDRVASAEARWKRMRPRYIPDEPILPGDETDRLHRWGYRYYREMFNVRQLVGLELSCRLISKIPDKRIRHALATNLSDLLRYQNLMCRYDTWALKSLDIFSVHGFPVGLIQCESNLLGITNERGIGVGSGGWSNIVEKYTKAKRYCHAPFEFKRQGSKNVMIPIKGEWIGETFNGHRPREVTLRCIDATAIELERNSLDAVFTDPPYFGNVQYGELMDFCYVWLRRLVGSESEGFQRVSTRADEELTGNVTKARGIEHFAEGLASVFVKMGKALKRGAPLAFTYHHNKLDAYYAVGLAILDSGLACTASLPCPGEMAGSIHIHGTSSSIIDTVFVCRSGGTVPKKWIFEDTKGLAHVVRNDLNLLRLAGMKPTIGDMRCIIYGHLTRMAIWSLRRKWKPEDTVSTKLDTFKVTTAKLGSVEDTLLMLESECHCTDSVDVSAHQLSFI